MLRRRNPTFLLICGAAIAFGWAAAYAWKNVMPFVRVSYNRPSATAGEFEFGGRAAQN